LRRPPHSTEVVSDRLGGHHCSSKSRGAATPPCLSAPATSSMNLLSTLAGCGVKPHSRRPCRPDSPRPRSPNPRGGILVSPRLEYVEHGVRRSLRRGYCRWQEGINSTLGPHGSTRSSAMPRSSRWRRTRQELMALDPQTSAACPRTSLDVQFSLKIRILHLGASRWANPNGGSKMVGWLLGPLGSRFRIIGRAFAHPR
jgi:hypothetical protein